MCGKAHEWRQVGFIRVVDPCRERVCFAATRDTVDPTAQTMEQPLGKPSAGRVPKMADKLPETRSKTCKWTRNRADLV
jgi:hypothetical protein